jgi:molybdopterin converting factor small subunit
MLLVVEMRVHLKFVGKFHEEFSTEDAWIYLQNGATMKEVLEKLEREKSIKVNLQDPSMVVLINGRRVEFRGGLNAALKNLDEIVIMPIIVGG